jgi:hypothetical protein
VGQLLDLLLRIIAADREVIAGVRQISDRHLLNRLLYFNSERRSWFCSRSTSISC